MKNIILVLVAGLMLGGCALAPYEGSDVRVRVSYGVGFYDPYYPRSYFYGPRIRYNIFSYYEHTHPQAQPAPQVQPRELPRANGPFKNNQRDSRRHQR